MAEVSLTAAFSTVPAAEAEEIKRVIVETVQQVAQDDGTFSRAKLVFTESDERCGLTAELDGVKKEGVPLQLDLDQLEDAKTSAGAPWITRSRTSQPSTPPLSAAAPGSVRASPGGVGICGGFEQIRSNRSPVTGA